MAMIEARRSIYFTSSSDARRRFMDRFMACVVYVCAAISVACLLIVLGYVIFRGAPALNVSFFTERPLPYGSVGGGVAPAIIGTITMLVTASLIAVPIGIGTAIYLSEFGRGQFARVVRFALDMLAGIPSIVVGVFVWALLVRQVIGQYSGLAGSVALAIIMIPIIARTVEEILRLVPNGLREAAFALGVPRWRTILGVVLPTARAGVITGIILSLARAGGETAPLLLTALGNQFFNFNLLEPVGSLPVQIYNYAVSPYDDWHTKAWGSALILLTVIGMFSLMTRFFTRQARLK